MWQAVKEKRCIHWEHWSYDTGFETEQENSGNISSLCNVAPLQQVNVQWSKVWPELQFYPLTFLFYQLQSLHLQLFLLLLGFKIVGIHWSGSKNCFFIHADLFRQINSTELLGQQKLISKKKELLWKNSSLDNYSRVWNKRSPTIINFLTFFQGLRPYSGLHSIR